jgi:hypothetical protein
VIEWLPKIVVTVDPWNNILLVINPPFPWQEDIYAILLDGEVFFVPGFSSGNPLLLLSLRWRQRLGGAGLGKIGGSHGSRWSERYSRRVDAMVE